MRRPLRSWATTSRSGNVASSRRRLLAKHELIGLEAVVVEATDPTHRGLEGRVVDETRNTLVLEASSRELIIPKKGSVFLFRMEEDVTIPGVRLLYRPEDRVKKAW